jgi:hypothetical protein
MLATFAAASAAAYQPPPPSLSRRAMLRATIGSGGLLVAAGAPSSALAADSTWAQSVGLLPKDREGLQAKWLEKVRILLQDEADAIQYGGQEGLAPGGPPSTVPALLLIPVVQMQAVLRELQPSLSDFSKWDQVMLVLERAPFETVALKRIFNAYADNIYYVSDSPEANAYLLGGATPSSKQTTQYLLRNEILKQLAELRDEIKYQKSIKPEERETEVAIEYMQNTLKAFDDYLKLSPADERATALEAVYDEKTAKGMLAALSK